MQSALILALMSPVAVIGGSTIENGSTGSAVAADEWLQHPKPTVCMLFSCPQLSTFTNLSNVFTLPWEWMCTLSPLYSISVNCHHRIMYGYSVLQITDMQITLICLWMVSLATLVYRKFMRSPAPAKPNLDGDAEADVSHVCVHLD